jgi:hypothetical protein
LVAPAATSSVASSVADFSWTNLLKIDRTRDGAPRSDFDPRVRPLRRGGWGVVKSLGALSSGLLVHRQKVRFFQKKNPTASPWAFQLLDPERTLPTSSGIAIWAAMMAFGRGGEHEAPRVYLYFRRYRCGILARPAP